MSVYLQETVRQALEVIHLEVNECRDCEPLVSNFQKPTSMSRGEPGRVVIVGQEPGKTEITSQKAFSGKSGRRLDQWLTASGCDAADPRKGIYATSVAKCLCDKPKLSLLYRNCSRFLEGQLRAIRPSLIISLGAVAYNAVRFSRLEFGAAVCKLYRSDADEARFRTKFGFDHSLMVWPHPSPGSRWHNTPENRTKLLESFETLRKYLANAPTGEENDIV